MYCHFIKVVTSLFICSSPISFALRKFKLALFQIWLLGFCLKSNNLYNHNKDGKQKNEH